MPGARVVHSASLVRCLAARVDPDTVCPRVPLLARANSGAPVHEEPGPSCRRGRVHRSFRAVRPSSHLHRRGGPDLSGSRAVLRADHAVHGGSDVHDTIGRLEDRALDVVFAYASDDAAPRAASRRQATALPGAERVLAWHQLEDVGAWHVQCSRDARQTGQFGTLAPGAGRRRPGLATDQGASPYESLGENTSSASPPEVRCRGQGGRPLATLPLPTQEADKAHCFVGASAARSSRALRSRAPSGAPRS